jgi:hypothetical protein
MVNASLLMAAYNMTRGTFVLIRKMKLQQIEGIK